MNKLRGLFKLGILSFCILFLLSWTWYLTIVLRIGIVHPLITIDYLYSDLEYLGPFAVILDILFLLIVWFCYKHIKSKQLDKNTDNE